jgi:hypothetical protein
MTADVGTDRLKGTGGRGCARQSRVVVAFVVGSLAGGSLVGAAAAGGQTAPVSVRNERGVYRVHATFTTPQPAAVGRAVLTDYEQIPRFLPDVRTSRVLERGADHAVVEQEAVARLLFFSKRIRLVLDVREAPATIAFLDRSGESFIRYEGQWTFRDEGGRAIFGYELIAQPRFDVPDFILARLLKRDAERMIERLKAEIAARAARAATLQSRR